jgi:hypothetical protein
MKVVIRLISCAERTQAVFPDWLVIPPGADAVQNS